MRDPAGSLRFDHDRVVRDLHAVLADDHFLRSELADRWVADGRLLPFEFPGPMQVTGPRLPFVSQPSEWTDAQLHAAGALTLSMQSEAVDVGFDLKDGSAWNVIFQGTRPVFCDLLSFKRLAEREWWAFGQFARHFLLPLLVSRDAGLRARESFSVWRDGMPAESARGLLGWTALLSRYGALLAVGRSASHSSVDVRIADTRRPLSDIQVFRRRLHATMEWQLEGLRTSVRKPRSSGWSDYERDRPHYGGDSLAQKRRLVGEWLARIGPAWVLDLGCNAGEFSLLALERGAQVIALDADHDSVQRLFLDHADNPRLHPLVAPLDDLRGSRGWGASEHPGLDHRLNGAVDMVLMLALIHHLAVGAAVPLIEVASFAYRCTRQALVVELLEADDPQLVALCRQRQRSPAEFSLERQRASFLAAGFTIQAEVRLDGAARSLLLLTR